jgi:hypothetical protein
MAWFLASGLLLAVATVLDFVIRLRITRAGFRWAFLLGGAFDYGEYHRVRQKYGWSPWPVRVFWVCAILGMLGIGFGVVRRYGL